MVHEGSFQMQWFDLSNAVFTTLGVNCPLLAPLQRTLGGLRTLLEVVCIGVKDRDNKSTCNQALLGLFQDAERAVEMLSFGYHPGYQRPSDGTLYADFKVICKRLLHHHPGSNTGY